MASKAQPAEYKPQYVEQVIEDTGLPDLDHFWSHPRAQTVGTEGPQGHAQKPEYSSQAQD